MGKKREISSDAAVILTLGEKQPLTPQEIIKETGLSKSATYRAIQRLLSTEVVKPLGRKYALQDFSSEEEEILGFLGDWERKHKDLPPPIDEIMLSINKDPEDVNARKKVRNILAKHNCSPSSPVPYEDRRRHTEELREVIKSWKEELPSVSDFGVEIVEIRPGVRVAGDTLFYKGQELAFEKQTLFPDLCNHLEPEVFEIWGKFKEEAKRFWGAREELTGKIEEMLKEKLGAVGVHDWRGKLKCGFITPQLIELVLQVAYALSSEQGRRMLVDHFVTGLEASKLEDEGYLIRSVGTEVFRISHEKNVEKIKEDMKHVVEEVRKKYSSELESLRSSLSTLESHRGEIVRILERYLHVQVLGGYCDYLILPPRAT